MLLPLSSKDLPGANSIKLNSQILTLNLIINCKNSIIYGKMAVKYEEKSFMEQAPIGNYGGFI